MPLVQVAQGDAPLQEGVVSVLGHDAHVGGLIALDDALLRPGLQVLDGVCGGAGGVPQHSGSAGVAQAEINVVVHILAPDMDHPIEQGLRAHNFLPAANLGVKVPHGHGQQLHAPLLGRGAGIHQHLAGHPLQRVLNGGHVLHGHQGGLRLVGGVADLLGNGGLGPHGHIGSHPALALVHVEGHFGGRLGDAVAEKHIFEKLGRVRQLAHHCGQGNRVKQFDCHRGIPP